jgi:hypothetical protein
MNSASGVAQVPCEPHLRVGRGNHGGGGEDALGERGERACHQQRTVRSLRQRLHLEAETGHQNIKFFIVICWLYLWRRTTPGDWLLWRVIEVVLVRGNVADQGCLSRFPDPNFSILDP